MTPLEVAASRVRVAWPQVIDLARDLVLAEPVEFGPPTLRRLHYLLVASVLAVDLGYRNSRACYQRLSERTAPLRRLGEFPPLPDMSRTIHAPATWDSELDVFEVFADAFRLDRCAQVPVALIVEKEGLVPALRSRYSWLPITAVHGYNSVGHDRALAELPHVELGIYAGDYDPSGLGIFDHLSQQLPFPLRRVALNREQVDAYGLPEALPKAGDSRLAAMITSEGRACQVELDALDPAVLLDLVGEAITEATGVELRADGWPVLPDIDVAEAAIRARFADLAGGAR